MGIHELMYNVDVRIAIARYRQSHPRVMREEIYATETLAVPLMMNN